MSKSLGRCWLGATLPTSGGDGCCSLKVRNPGACVHLKTLLITFKIKAEHE